MKLFVDDIRECPPGWTLARTISEAVRLLAYGVVEEISLDYDIRTCSNKRCREHRETFEPVYLYLGLMNRDTRPEIRIHTGNVEEGRRMARILDIPYHNEIYNPENYNEDLRFRI